MNESFRWFNKRIEGEHNLIEGGNIVLASDTNILILRAHLHSHKVHDDECFTQEGHR